MRGGALVSRTMTRMLCAPRPPCNPPPDVRLVPPHGGGGGRSPSDGHPHWGGLQGGGGDNKRGGGGIKRSCKGRESRFTFADNRTVHSLKQPFQGPVPAPVLIMSVTAIEWHAPSTQESHWLLEKPPSWGLGSCQPPHSVPHVNSSRQPLSGRDP